MSTETIVVFIATLIGGAIAAALYVTWLTSHWRRFPLSFDDLADRADVNGSELVRLAREIRAVAATEQRGLKRGQMLRWAAVLESVAVEHLECLNAISLDALQAVGSHAVPHLGEFVGDRRRNPPLQRVSALLLKRGRPNA